MKVQPASDKVTDVERKGMRSFDDDFRLGTRINRIMAGSYRVAENYNSIKILNPQGHSFVPEVSLHYCQVLKVGLQTPNKKCYLLDI